MHTAKIEKKLQSIESLPIGFRNNTFLDRSYDELFKLYLRINPGKRHSQNSSAIYNFDCHDGEKSFIINATYFCKKENMLHDEKMNMDFDKEKDICKLFHSNIGHDEDSSYNYSNNLNLQLSKDKNHVLVCDTFTSVVNSITSERELNSVFDNNGNEIKRKIVAKNLNDNTLLYVEEYFPIKNMDNIYIGKYISDQTTRYSIFKIPGCYADQLFGSSFNVVRNFDDSKYTLSFNLDCKGKDWLGEISQVEYESLILGDTPEQEAKKLFKRTNRQY